MKTKENVVATIPSLVINVTDQCNLQCSYCPPYGENLCKGDIDYDLPAVLTVIQCAKQAQLPLLRITGGEPLIVPERTEAIISSAQDSFQRLVLNTNGVDLDIAIDWLRIYRSNIVLKVSLDTISSEEYCNITKRDKLDRVMAGILHAKGIGFSVEINIVITTQSVESLLATIRFALQHKFHVKLLTESNFYGYVTPTVNSTLTELIARINKTYILEKSEKLIGNRGISMLTYKAGNSKIQIVDHSTQSSVTPNRTYFSQCPQECVYFPCDCGAISLALSTDGILTPCRGRKDLGKVIFGRSPSEIYELFYTVLKQYSHCINININNM